MELFLDLVQRIKQTLQSWEPMKRLLIEFRVANHAVKHRRLSHPLSSHLVKQVIAGEARLVDDRNHRHAKLGHVGHGPGGTRVQSFEVRLLQGYGAKGLKVNHIP